MGLDELSAAEVDYDRTALKTVVCQLQFNEILRIGKEDPAEFQEAIRHEFPIFERREGQLVSFSFGPSPAVEHAPMAASYLFKSDDGWIVALGTNSLSLETSNYVHFMDFLGRFKAVRAAAEAHYTIPSYTRAGLRYINLFTAADFPGSWLSRFNPGLLGALADAQLGPDVSFGQQLIRFDFDQGYLTLRHGLNPDKSYTLDLDRALEDKIEPGDTDALLQDFNRTIFQVFRWSISDALHKEMGPHAR